MNTDMYSLLAWARDESLKAHTAKYSTYPNLERAVLAERERCFDELIRRIEHNPNQRPHVNIQVMGDDV